MAMQLLMCIALCALVAGCAGGGSPTDQARNDHDLGVLNDAELALTSQLSTDGRNVGAVLNRGEATPVPMP